MIKPKWVKICWSLLWPPIKGLIDEIFSPNVMGLENLEKLGPGPVIVYGNHTSYVDPFVLVGVTPPEMKLFPVFWMGKKDIFTFCKGLLAPIAHMVGIFPLNPETRDIKALKTALTLLKEGRAVGIFPEGTRSPKGVLLDFNPGAAYLALRSGAQCLPVAILGTHGIRFRDIITGAKSVKVAFGEPFVLADVAFQGTKKEQLLSANRLMREKIRFLLAINA